MKNNSFISQSSKILQKTNERYSDDDKEINEQIQTKGLFVFKRAVTLKLHDCIKTYQ